MKLNIKEAVPNSKTPNSYEVVIETMSGDADGFENIIVGPFIKDQDEPIMEHLLGVIEEMSKAYPHGMGGSDNFNHIKHFDTWFNTFDDFGPEEEYAYQVKSDVTYEEYLELNKTFQAFKKDSMWPTDPMTDYTVPNGYRGFEIYYYDENKKQYDVEVEA
jgi:hypothetical protein